MFNLWPNAALQTQWPGTGVPGDPIFDTFYSSLVPSLASDQVQSLQIKAAGARLLDAIGVRCLNLSLFCVSF